MLPSNNVSFITNNVKGMQSSKKSLDLMQYFKDKKDKKNGNLKVQFFFLTECQILVAS